MSSAKGVPTFASKGYDLQLTQYRGFYVQTGVDPEICQLISEMIDKAAHTDSFKAYMKEQSLDDGYMDQKLFTDYARSDYEAVKALSEKLLK